MADRDITCAECGGVFVFTDAEQAFYTEKGLAAPPKRCKPCRLARKAGHDARGRARPRETKEYRSPTGGGYMGGDWGPKASAPARLNGAAGGRPRADPPADLRPPRPRFDITCATCGVQAHVPFKPSDGRQVFCQACYRARRSTARPEVEPIGDDKDTGIVE